MHNIDFKFYFIITVAYIAICWCAPAFLPGQYVQSVMETHVRFVACFIPGFVIGVYLNVKSNKNT